VVVAPLTRAVNALTATALIGRSVRIVGDPESIYSRGELAEKGCCTDGIYLH
jgi:hypothetical protein